MSKDAKIGCFLEPMGEGAIIEDRKRRLMQEVDGLIEIGEAVVSIPVFLACDVHGGKFSVLGH
jgi:hypothetical protein